VLIHRQLISPSRFEFPPGRYHFFFIADQWIQILSCSFNGDQLAFRRQQAFSTAVEFTYYFCFSEEVVAKMS